MAQRDQADEPVNIADELTTMSFEPPGFTYQLLLGDEVSGCEGIEGAYLICRTGLERATDYTGDVSGSYVPLAEAHRPPADPAARRLRARLRRAVARARGESEFVLCYHVESDRGWYMTWSAGHTRDSATAALHELLRGGLLWS